jgi:hypothetical protein
MSNLQNEILEALEDIQKKMNNSQSLTEKDLETLLLSALIEEEA